MRYQKVNDMVVKVIEPSISIIKRARKRNTMPFRDIESILKIVFPRTKYYESNKGFFKHVFVIHSDKRKLVLKIGRARKHIKKDYKTYKSLPKNIRNRYFAKIYWIHNLFMLQKYGRKVRKVPSDEIQKLKDVGKKYHLKDIREANIMKFDNGYKIVDAERV